MKKLLLAAVMAALVGLSAQAQSYSNAVMGLNPIGYWPLNDNTPPAPSYIATNYGTLGSLGEGHYANTLPDSLGSAAYTLISTPASGATSDGDTAAAFNTNSANYGDPSGYLVIPRRSPLLSPANAFSAEIWVKPLGGDPNDPTGASYASTEWASLIKEGYGGNGYGDPGDANNNGYGWSVSLAGIYTLGYPVGWYTPGPTQLLTNAQWVVDFFPGNNGGTPSLEFDVPMYEPTPEWFHLVLAYDGTNANFYTNGVLAATTVLGTPASTNKIWAPGSATASATGAYMFTPHNGVSYAPDTVNPVVFGTINQNGNIINNGYPNTPEGTVGFNEQTYNGLMDEAAIYDSALSAATVAKHFSDATASDHTAYTNDVLSLNPPIYLRFDEPAYVEPASTDYPFAHNAGSAGSSVNGLIQPGVVPDVPGPDFSGFGTGSAASAFAFDGLDSAVDVQNAVGSALDPGGNTPFSLVFWFKGNPGQYARFETILGRGDSGWRSSIDQGGKIHWNPGAGPEITAPKNYNDGAWHQVVGVTDGSTAYLYVDNQLTVTNGPVGALGGSQYDFYIGGAPDYTITKPNGQAERLFAGDLTQVAFFGTALTPAQIQTLYFAANLPASILTQPAASTVIVSGQTGTVQVVTSGTPPLSYQWLQNGGVVGNAGSFSGVNSNILTIANASSLDAGTFTVVVSNTYGAVTSSPAIVTVSTAPVILTQPSPPVSTVYAGNDVTFSVSATGAAPLAYQWFENSTPILSATGTNLTIAAPVGSNNFTVQVTNSSGSATSSNVALIGVQFVAPASGFALNFNNAGNGPYAGLGAYPDAANNTNWNVFPNSGATTPPATNSAGGTTLSSLTLIYGFNNGANNGTANNQPCFLVEYESGINGGNPGIGTSANPMGSFQLNDVPQGAYSLYLYSANYDGNRGSVFDLSQANGGEADGGTNATTNVQSDHSCDTLVEGDNYVLFLNVTPDASGTISGTFIPNPNGQLTGEGQIDALQLVLTPNRSTNTVQIAKGASGTVIITWASGSLQSGPTVTGPWSAVTGTSPLTVTISGAQEFYRVQ